MSSTRLPGKALADISGYPMLWHVVSRVQASKLIDQVVVATSNGHVDDVIFEFCKKKPVDCFRGSETDVMRRYYEAAKQYGADAIVRISADCPLVDPRIIDRVVETYLQGGYDYVSNTIRPTFPDGLDVEVFSFNALEQVLREATLPAEREHVTPYIRTSGKFRMKNVEDESHLSGSTYRWTVDEPCDLELVRAIYKELDSNRHFGYVEVFQLLQRRPDLMTINKSVIRNEGYYRSLAKEKPLPPRKRDLKRSLELKSTAELLIPSCSQTFSKGPTQYVQGVAPTFLSRGKGSHVWDVDGNEYIDFPMALGAIILGHNYPAVSEAVRHQIESGTTFSLPHELEIEVAQLLTQVIPCAEMVRFAKNGSDATSGAVRLARAYTGREIIANCGYHGWQDWYIGTTTRDKGIPRAVKELTLPFEYNNIESLRRIMDTHDGQVAAVVMEPTGIVAPKPGFLQDVQRIARDEGALLVFDEIVTGFRMRLGGAEEYFHITPDLACFGKAMANGYPISTVVGRRDIMKLMDEIFFSFTYGGETLSLAATKATINEFRARNVVEQLWDQGQKLKDGYTVLARELSLERYTECVGFPPRTVISFNDETGKESLLFKSIFQQECLKRGILFSGSQNICYSHSDEDVDYTLRVYRAALDFLKGAISTGNPEKLLEGDPVQPVFRRA